jgi:hypothetical protein
MVKLHQDVAGGMLKVNTKDADIPRSRHHHKSYFVRSSNLFPEKLQFSLPGLVVLQKLVSEDGDVQKRPGSNRT